MSPSEPECSSASATTGPRGASSGRSNGWRCRGDVPPDHPARQLLDHQLRGVAAAVAAHVEDQPVARGLPARNRGAAAPSRWRPCPGRAGSPGGPRSGRRRTPAARPPSPGSAAPPPRTAARRRPGAPRLAPGCRMPGPVRTVSSTSRSAVPTSSGAGPHSGPRVGRHLEDHVAGPHVDPRAGQRAPRVRRRGLGGSTRATRQPSSCGSRSAPSRPGRPDRRRRAARRTRRRARCPARRSPPTARRRGRRGCPPRRPAAGSAPAPPPSRRPAMSATQKWSRMSRPASSNICRHSAAGSTVTTIAARVDRVLVGARSTGPSVGALDPGPVGAQHPQRRAVADDEPRAVAAHRVGAHRVGDHVELAAGQVEALQHGLVRLHVGRPRGRRRACR